MYREIKIKGEITTDMMNKISEIFGNREDIKLILNITYEDLIRCDDKPILLNGKNSFMNVYPNEHQLKKEESSPKG